ncbi:uncharacterized protein LOC129407536 [Boleophthalmus pectinirostris]|uniref:uncharacterized protein LOC129407536 n=1 Tax=Boleophthalmus pectinirostris TaxID=150288 RepID=UPI0024324592|nr:uncharacterized protein LOC129407536 [Boleophthalmus pectinirostris]
MVFSSMFRGSKMRSFGRKRKKKRKETRKNNTQYPSPLTKWRGPILIIIIIPPAHLHYLWLQLFQLSEPYGPLDDPKQGRVTWLSLGDKVLVLVLVQFLLGLVLLGLTPVLLEAQKVLETFPGQNVTLECFGPARSKLELLQWVRLDLVDQGYVYFYRENRLYESYQIPSYRSRVFFREPTVGPGDLTLVLHDVKPEDTGTYECRTSEQNVTSQDKYYKTQASIWLTVKGHKRVHADPGQDLVLPCSGPKMEQIQLLQWSRLDRNHSGFIYVHEPGTKGRDPESELTKTGSTSEIAT